MIFLLFYIDFTSSLFNAPWAPGPRCNFFLLSPTGWATGTLSPISGATGTHFWKFPYSAYIFEILFFLNIKMKKALQQATRDCKPTKSCVQLAAQQLLKQGNQGSICIFYYPCYLFSDHMIS